MKSQFDASYPSTPDNFHLALEHTCREIEQMNTAANRRIRWSTVLIAAMIATLLLAALAYAAMQSRILDRLFSGGKPNLQAESLVQPLRQTATKDGITIAFDECVVDGDRWYLGYQIRSEREDTVLYTTAWSTTLTEHGSLLDRDGWNMLALGGSVDGVAMPKFENGICTEMSIGMESLPTPDEPFDVTVKVRVAKPKMQLVLWQKPADNDFDAYATISKARWKRFKSDKQIPIYVTGITEFPKWITAINDASQIGLMKVCENAGCVEPFTEITLTATIDPATAPRQEHMRLAEPQRFEFDDYDIEVDVVDLTSTRSDIRFDIVPKQWQDESGRSEESYMMQFNRDYDLLNEKGERILSTRYGIVSWVDDPLRFKRVRYTCQTPLTELCEALTIVPVTWEGKGIDRMVKQHDMAHAVTVQLGKVSAVPKTVPRVLPKIESVAKAFFGEDVELLKPQKSEFAGAEQWSDLALHNGDHIERYIDFISAEGRFSMSRPSAIQMPDAFDAPTTGASGIPGRYTQDEALVMAQKFLTDVLGVDTSLLTAYVTAESERNARSRRYEIGFEYRSDGVPLTDGDKYIRVAVTDEGIVDVQGYSLEIKMP